jgi:hypothetical protein
MNPDPSKLRQEQQQAEEAAELHSHLQSPTGHQFNSVEELIRFDTAQTVPPETVAARLKESIAREPAPRPWWRRLFGKRS